MTRALLAVCAFAACATPGPVTWEDVEPPAVAPVAGEQPHDAPRPRVVVTAPIVVGPVATAPTAVSAPAVVSAPAANARALALFGTDVADGAFVDAPALSLACLADPRALTEPALAFGRLEEEARKLGATLGEPRVVRLVRDPARSLTDPPPRACRPIVEDVVFKAPLSREAEPASRWLVTTSAGRVPDDATRALARAAEQKLTTTAPPRVIVDENGAILAIVVPVEGG